MKATHTPGPWECHRHKEQDNKKAGFIVIQSRYRNAANVATVIPCIGMKPEEVESNARLIAAAPDLLGAIKVAIETIRNLHGDAGWEIYDKYSPEMKQINSAFKKATCDE